MQIDQSTQLSAYESGYQLGEAFGEQLAIVIVFGFCVALLFAPYLIAKKRNHMRLGLIALLNWIGIVFAPIWLIIFFYAIFSKEVTTTEDKTDG
jgi:hypothetical protein